MDKKTTKIIQELEAMTEHLQDYVLGGRLFKTITVFGANPHLIKMTLGGMLERMAELKTLEKDVSDSKVAEVVRQAEEALKREQRSQPNRFFKLLAREAKSYTDSWKWFLQNCWEGDARCASDYAQEVGIRLRLQRLLSYGGQHAELAESRQRIGSLDERLRTIWQEAEHPIIGDKKHFSPKEYWWLYGQPRP
ncbi:MAG: hypothetical protein ACPGWR_06080 [Ardenticatenaceae bacterium]